MKKFKSINKWIFENCACDCWICQKTNNLLLKIAVYAVWFTLVLCILCSLFVLIVKVGELI